MGSDIQNKKLGEMANIKGGKRMPKGEQLTETKNLHPYIRVRDINDGFIDKNNLLYVPDEIYPEISRYIVHENDLIISIVGTIGLVSSIEKDLHNANLTENAAKILITDPSLHAKYLEYFLRSRQGKHQISINTVGSTQPKLPLYGIQNIEVPVLPLREQIRIAQILSSFDDKIELNQRMNETLEAIARGIFKSWFVDFDPVRAKMAGESYPLPDAVIALFPDALVESDLGMIPKGWTISTINDEIELVGGGTPSTRNPKYWENGIYNFATPKDLSNLSSIVLLDTDRKVTKAGLTKISSGLLEPGTLLMSSRAPVGYLAINQIPVCINQGFIAMKCNKRLTANYMLNWAKTHMEEIKARASGTTFSELSKRNFRPMKILVPSQEIVAAFERYISSQFKQLRLNLQLIKTLFSQREELIKFIF